MTFIGINPQTQKKRKKKKNQCYLFVPSFVYLFLTKHCHLVSRVRREDVDIWFVGDTRVFTRIFSTIILRYTDTRSLLISTLTKTSSKIVTGCTI